MTLEMLRTYCTSLPFVTEDIKWGDDLCFSIGGKMFCVAALDDPLMVSIKVKDEEFDELSSLTGIKPAPYVGRYQWIWVEDVKVFSDYKWKDYIRQSYELVKMKLPKSVLNQLK